VQAASNAGTLERLLSSVLLPRGHETRHLVLSELDLAAAKGRQADVGNLVLGSGSRHGGDEQVV